MTIHSPLEWGWDQFRGAVTTVGAGRQETAAPARRGRALAVRRIGYGDLRTALARGMEDFGAGRTDVIFLCVFYPVVGLALAWLAFGHRALPMIFPLGAGFALLGPVAAVGLNEMSRRREQGAPIRWADAFGVLRAPTIGSIFLMGAILAEIFVLWLVVADLIWRATLAPSEPGSYSAFVPWLAPAPATELPAAAPPSVGTFLSHVFTTGPGWAMIVIGIAVGFLFAALVLAISVVSFPLLLDREDASVEMAVATSFRVVRTNPGPIAAWGLIVAALLLVGTIPFLIGLAVVLPVLGHATWHLYRLTVVEAPMEAWRSGEGR